MNKDKGNVMNWVVFVMVCIMIFISTTALALISQILDGTVMIAAIGVLFYIGLNGLFTIFKDGVWE